MFLPLKVRPGTGGNTFSFRKSFNSVMWRAVGESPAVRSAAVVIADGPWRKRQLQKAQSEFHNLTYGICNVLCQQNGETSLGFSIKAYGVYSPAECPRHVQIR